MDAVFTASFCLEALMKMVVTGLAFNGPASYMRRCAAVQWLPYSF